MNLEQIVGVIATILFGCVVLAALFEHVVEAASAVVNVFASAFSFLRDTTERSVVALGPVADRAHEGLAYGSSKEPTTSSWLIWDLVGPLVYFVLLACLLAGDYVSAMLRFGALLGASVPTGGPSLGLIFGGLWVATVLAFGGVFFDCIGVSPLGRPFHNLREGLRKRLAFVVGVCMALSLLSGAAFLLWGQSQIDHSGSRPLGFVFIGTFGLLMNGALVLLGWSLVVSLGVVVSLMSMLVRLLLRSMAVLAAGVVRLLDMVAEVLISVIAVPAGLGRGLWNWICKFKCNQSGVRHGCELSCRQA